ncbi:hypothetical protein [Streptomyces afghaniensis]|uniref:hypothetical protein n=1 Tax=Streptomyces afghaniensis TaxID=66865 RepID=UPI0027825990|nr:hypothetical protein [Streptomyces afghaniensis]MDQ1021162.1 ABC-type dipeptide/oligopeptide/nickel transport system permease component [Streptomyces afghaniensis]
MKPNGVARWALGRAAGTLLVLVVVTVLVFAATEAAPGDAATARLGPQATPGTVEALRAQLGLDRPAPLRYLDWLGHALRATSAPATRTGGRWAS